MTDSIKCPQCGKILASEVGPTDNAAELERRYGAADGSGPVPGQSGSVVPPEDRLYFRIARLLTHEAHCGPMPGRECVCARVALLAELSVALCYGHTATSAL